MFLSHLPQLQPLPTLVHLVLPSFTPQRITKCVLTLCLLKSPRASSSLLVPPQVSSCLHAFDLQLLRKFCRHNSLCFCLDKVHFYEPCVSLHSCVQPYNPLSNIGVSALITVLILKLKRLPSLSLCQFGSAGRSSQLRRTFCSIISSQNY